MAVGGQGAWCPGSDGSDPPDPVLWSAAREGHERAFEVLYRRHVGAVTRHCRRHLSVHGTAEVAQRCEDVVSETFLHAWRRRSAILLADGCSLLPWLMRTATHCCENTLRSDRRRRRLLGRLREQRQESGPENAPATTASDREVLTIARAAIGRLRPVDARVAEMCLLGEVPPRDAATALRVSEAALRSRLVRLRRALRAELGTPGLLRALVTSVAVLGAGLEPDAASALSCAVLPVRWEGSVLRVPSRPGAPAGGLHQRRPCRT